MLAWYLLRSLAIATLALWPIIPLLWIQVHGSPSFWRKVGGLTYLVVLLEMVPVVFFVILFQEVLLGVELNLGGLVLLGTLFLTFGIALHAWTGKLLGWKTLVGYSELRPRTGPTNAITSGPFSVVRHPTYLAHTLILVGVFLMTGFVGTGFLAVLDFGISYFLIIPLEERELIIRFGADYRRYQHRVPKLLPVRFP